jgi:FkbM family methyltransferase
MLFRKSFQMVKSRYIRAFGLGYVKRRITGGPIKGLWLIAGKRVFYSKSFWNGTYEENTCYFLQKTVPENAVCYDIGANIGYHTLIMARSANNGGLVYSFEPIPEVCEVLTHNAKINNLHNVVVVNKVVSRESGISALIRSIDIDQATLSAKIKKNNPLRETITCSATTIDDFVAAGSRPPSLLKIDVEGAEVDVLAGATDTIKSYHPLIVCETHGVTPACGVYKILAALNYELFCVNQNMVSIDAMTQMPTNMYEGHVFARLKKP